MLEGISSQEFTFLEIHIVLFFLSRHILNIYVVLRKMADPAKFMEEIAMRILCCYNLCDLKDIVGFYQVRLDTWSGGYKDQ